MSSRINSNASLLRESMAPYIIEYANERYEHFGLVSVVDVKVSKDHSYADFYVTSQYNAHDLPKYLAKYAGEIRSMIGRDLGARKSPAVRFKVTKGSDGSQDIGTIIDELSAKYGLR